MHKAAVKNSFIIHRRILLIHRKRILCQSREANAFRSPLAFCFSPPIPHHFSCTTKTSFRQPPSVAHWPRFVQVTVPSVVVPFTTGFQGGRADPDVPPTVAFSTFPFESITFALRA